MVTLRHFTRDDADTIQEMMYPSISREEIDQVLGEWTELSYQGKYFEMLAVESDGRIVGNISLFEQREHIASIGIEIFPSERRNGFAAEAMTLLCKKASGLGYEIIVDEIRADNTASLKLHEKLGFESSNHIYRNSKGHEAVRYFKVIAGKHNKEN